MDIQTLCKKIELVDEMVNEIIKYDKGVDYNDYSAELNKLNQRKSWDEGLKELKEKLGEDSTGIKVLTMMLHNSCHTYDSCINAGIKEEILIETFKAFSRFVNEHKASYGSFGFDRAFWTSRQASGNLFRIGELEYEFIEGNNGHANLVSLHIPSDSNLSSKNVASSIAMARDFIARFYPDYASSEYECESWLLSPSLKELLPADSNIIKFQSLFSIYKTDPEAPDVFEWVYKNPNIKLEDAPEKTSLQRNMKHYMLKGGKIGVGFGKLI